MKNELIKSYLLNSKNEYEKVFKAFAKKEVIFEEAYLELEKFNFEEYKLKLEK